MTADEKVIDKIRKVLALAEGAKTEGEAQAAYLQAQKLMVKHGLELADIGDANPAQREITDVEIDSMGNRVWWKESLAMIIGDNFRCQVYLSTTRGDPRVQRLIRSLRFIGLAEDVEIATEVYASAVKTAQRLLRVFLDTERAKLPRTMDQGHRTTWGVQAKQSWLTGFLQGLQTAFREQVERENWGLILVKPQEVSDALAAKNPKKISAVGTDIDRGNFAAHRAGYDAGKSFVENRGKKRIEGA